MVKLVLGFVEQWNNIVIYWKHHLHLEQCVLLLMLSLQELYSLSITTLGELLIFLFEIFFFWYYFCLKFNWRIKMLLLFSCDSIQYLIKIIFKWFTNIFIRDHIQFLYCNIWGLIYAMYENIRDKFGITFCHRLN
jgi:hypothetical protein